MPPTYGDADNGYSEQKIERQMASDSEQGYEIAVPSFTRRADAVNWARGMELKGERGNPRDAPMLASERISLGDVLVRYRDTVTSLKRCVDNERYAIRGFLRTCPTLSQ